MDIAEQEVQAAINASKQPVAQQHAAGASRSMQRSILPTRR